MVEQGTFDFIVVGGGTAGLVVAARLSEDSSISVAVIEAGRDDTKDDRIKIPGKWTANLGRDLDWNYMCEPQKGLNGRKVSRPAGRTLGGSSAINGLTFIYPIKTVVDGWASLGNPIWTWDNLRPYWRKAHTLTISPEERAKHLYLNHLDVSAGCSGPVQACFCAPTVDPFAPAWSETFKNVGWEASGNADAGLVTGGFNSAANIDPVTKERSYSAPAYLEPIRHQPNLKVLVESVAENIVFETSDAGEKATGVQYSKAGTTRLIHARKEVIVSSGVFGSPKLLELSGIGDPALLKQYGIEERVGNSSVGEGMQDHLMTGISFEANDNVETLDNLVDKDPAALAAAADAYGTRREGPHSLAGINYFSFMPIDSQGSTIGPELERLLQQLDAKGQKGLELQYEYLESVIRNRDKPSGAVYFKPQGMIYGVSSKASEYSVSSLTGKYLTIGFSLIQPFSRGSTHINSANPLDVPVIETGYLSNPVDVEVTALNFAFIEKLAKTKPLAHFLKPGGHRNDKEARGDDRETARRWAKRSLISNWHGCGTCAMMPREFGGVVSQKLLVYGTANVRVVDASIIPIIPAGQIQTSVYMLAEHAADIIKADHKLCED